VGDTFDAKDDHPIDAMTCWELFRIARLLRRCSPTSQLLAAELQEMAELLEALVGNVEEQLGPANGSGDRVSSEQLVC
jgi:hypothetical protein